MGRHGAGSHTPLLTCRRGRCFKGFLLPACLPAPPQPLGLLLPLLPPAAWRSVPTATKAVGQYQAWAIPLLDLRRERNLGMGGAPELLSAPHHSAHMFLTLYLQIHSYTPYMLCSQAYTSTQVAIYIFTHKQKHLLVLPSTHTHTPHVRARTTCTHTCTFKAVTKVWQLLLPPLNNKKLLVLFLSWASML